MWNAVSPGFELVSPCPIPATITITPWAPPLPIPRDNLTVRRANLIVLKISIQNSSFCFSSITNFCSWWEITISISKQIFPIQFLLLSIYLFLLIFLSFLSLWKKKTSWDLCFTWCPWRFISTKCYYCNKKIFFKNKPHSTSNKMPVLYSFCSLSKVRKQLATCFKWHNFKKYLCSESTFEYIREYLGIYRNSPDFWFSQLGLQNTSTAYLWRGVNPTPMSVLDATLNNLIVRLQLWEMRSTPSLPWLVGPL